MNQQPRKLRIDLGCGSVKKPGMIGVDVQNIPGVDFVVDVEKEPLPFPDCSVEYIYSNHFLEHTVKPAHLFIELSRVCANNASLELWTPYAWSDSAFITDHKFFFTEGFYLHICVLYADFWTQIYKTRWILNEFRYIVEPQVLCFLERHGIGLDFALKHLHNVAKEYCAFITVHRDLQVPSPPYRRTFSTNRGGAVYDIREVNADPYTEDELGRAIRKFSRGNK
jgi:hypothetical protein